MLNPDLLDDQQRYCIREMVKHKRRLVIAPMGTGKTVSSLTAMAELFDNYEITAVLVVAPNFVSRSVWHTEIKKWSQLKGLSCTVLTGNPKKRIVELAKTDRADITVISTNLFDFLVEELLLEPRKPNKDSELKPKRHWKPRKWWEDNWRYDVIIFDEIDYINAPTANVSKSTHIAAQAVDRFYGLSGTLTGGNEMGVWSPMKTMDFGKGLGLYISHYHKGFFQYCGYSRTYTLLAGMKEAIAKKVAEFCIKMLAPDREYGVRTMIHKVDLPPNVMKKYKEFQKEFLIEVESGDVSIDYAEEIDDVDEFEAANSAVLSGKLRQMASGTLIAIDEPEDEFSDEPPVKRVVPIHDVKLKKLDEIMSSTEEHLLIFYWFRGDGERLKQKYGDNIVLMSESKDLNKTIELWNDGKIQYLAGNPGSAGHGLNLQFGGRHVVWFSLPAWSSKRWEQANARIDRRGQLLDVIIHVIMAADTIDETEYAVVLRKMTREADLIRFISDDIKRRQIA